MGATKSIYSGLVGRPIWLLGVGLMFCLFVGRAFAGGGPNVGGAKLYIQQNDLDKATSVLTKEVKEVNERNEDAWYLLGYVYARQQKYEEMIEAFNRAVELKPKFRQKGVRIGKDSGTQFHSKHGVDAILRVVWANAFNSGVRHFNDAVNAAEEEARQENFDKAIAMFSAAAVIAPDSSLAYRNWAAALINAERTTDAIAPLMKALEVNPKDKEVKIMLAQVHVRENHYDQALPFLEELWAENVRSVEVADYLSRAYLKVDKPEQAKGVYKAAIESNPENFSFRYNYGTILLEAKEYDEAIEQLSKAYEIDPESADINYNLGAAYLNRGVSKREALPDDSEDLAYVKDFELAFPYLEKSTKMNPDDVGSWFTLGRIAGQLNKISLAGYAFSKGEPLRSALDNKVIVGMPSETLKAILGDPDEIKPLESKEFNSVQEWVYRERRGARGKVAIPDPMNVYVANGRVDALMVEK
ncbi:MAG: tetratricopeptide repeat protein [bacterium]